MQVIKLDDKNDLTHYKFFSYMKMGNILEVQKMTNKNVGCVLKKIDKKNYVDLRTGELKEYKNYESRSDDTTSIRRSMNNLRGYINNNVLIAKNCKWVTFTYSDNMTDVKQLYQDFNKFFKRFTYQLNKRSLEKPEYISVIEPQGRGAWHIHSFLIWKNQAPYIPKNLDVVLNQNLLDSFNLADIWGHGFVDIQNVKDIDNLGAYFTAYLTDIPLDETEQKNISDKEIVTKTYVNSENKEVTKKFVKGERLKLYPAGMNLYRCSKGIIKPEKIQTTIQEIEKKTSDATEVFSRTFSIVDNDNDNKVINTISKKQYKYIITENTTKVKRGVGKNAKTRI